MRYLSGIILLSLLAWGISLPADAWSQGFFFWRAQGIQLSGLLAIVLLSALLNGEPLFRWQYMGALVLVCVGIWLVNKAPKKEGV